MLPKESIDSKDRAHVSFITAAVTGVSSEDSEQLSDSDAAASDIAELLREWRVRELIENGK